MRTQAVVAAWLLLLLGIADARFAKQLSAVKLRTEGKLTKITAVSRRFQPQESNSELFPDMFIPASNDSVCQEAGFAALVNATINTCYSVPFPNVFNESLPGTASAHRAAWNEFCTPCGNVAKTAVTGRYWVCLQPDIQFVTSQANYLCSNKDSHGDVCGLTLSRVSFATFCDFISDPSDCRKFGSGSCRWSGGICQMNASQALFETICGTCLTGLIKNVYSNFPGFIDQATVEATQSICARSPSGAFCVPLLWSLSADGGDSVEETLGSNAGMATFCKNDDMVACFSGFMAHNAAQTIDAARDEFAWCADDWGNVARDVTKRCLPTFLETVNEAQTVSAVVGAMCTNFNGTYCVPAFYALDNVTEGKDGCPSNAAATVTKLGCCIGTIQSLWSLIQTTSNDTSLLPPIPGYTPPIMQQTLPPAPATQHPVVLAPGEELSPNPGNGGFFNFAACGVTGLNESLRVRCAQNRFEFSKNLLLKLNYAAVTATPAMKEAFMMALRRDVARNAKVSPNQITDDAISATNRVQVTTASGRGMQVQATASGVQYSYTLQASSKAQAQAASENVDAAVNVGHLDMTSTQATVEERCAACVGLGGAASVSQASSTTVGNTIIDVETSSGAAAMGTLLAILLTALAIYF